MQADEVSHLGRDHLTPAATIENTVMANLGGHEIGFPGRVQIGGKGERGFGLADAGNIIALAFHAQNRGFLDGRRVNRLVPVHHFTLGQRMGLKHGFNGLEIEFRRHVHHRTVFLIEGTGRFRIFPVAFHQMIEEFMVLHHMVSQIHAHESGKLQKSRINLAPHPRIGRRHMGDHIALKPAQRTGGGQIIHGRRVGAGIDGPPIKVMDKGAARFPSASIRAMAA